MSTFKCKMCGGTLEIQNGSTVAECEYCGAKQTLPKLDDEKRANLYDRANHFRRSNEFDKATAIYEQILNEDGTDAEAYWSLVLCHYGVEYVEDPLSHRRVPTVHRAQFTSIFDDDNYKLALKNADSYQRIIYEEEAKAINEIQKGILAISQKEEPFDVFICYKETDANGKRTHDSVLANDLYYQLKQEGFKVFFARITLEDKLGSAYEPYIFAALNSAKVMVVLGTKPEFFNAVWVRNEWSRFLSLVKQGEKKMLIPAYRDMDPYDLPQEFSHLQAQDMSKLGFMQDLIRGIKKILGKDKKPVETVTERVIVNNEGHDIAPILRRTFLFLEDGEFDNADEYAEKVLDINPECAEAYVAKLLIELELCKPADLAMAKEPISDSPNYQKAIRFASPEYRETIEGYNNAIIKRIDTARKDEVYARGVDLMKLHRYDEAVQYFQKNPAYKDSTQKIADCKQLKETERLDGIYSRAIQLLSVHQYDEAAQLFASIPDYKDAKEKVKVCGERKEIARKDAIYAQAMQRVQDKNANSVAILRSIEALKTISGYKDVDDQIRSLDARLEKWYADKKKAEEEARIRAEEERRTREREAELKRLKAEENKRKAKKAAKIGIPSVIAAAILVVLLITFVIPLIRYNQADALFNEGKYEEAMVIYQDIGGFSESEQRIAVLEGIDKIDDADFSGGIKQILAVGVPVKLTYGMGGGDFSGATHLNVPQNDFNNGTILLSASTTPNVTPLSSAADVPETTEFTYNSAVDFTGIQTPGRNGYRFVRWELETYSYQVEGTFEIKLNAVWSTKDYTVTYNLAGGKISGKNVAQYDPEDKAFTLINPTRTGYTFAGWIGTDLPAPTINVTVPAGSYGNRTYTATWTANEYTVTYDAAGGTVSSKTQKVAYDSNVEYLIPERTGYKFLGWYENTTKHENEKWTRTSNLSLVAKWEIIGYTIEYNLNGGTNYYTGNPTNYNVATNTITLKNPSRTGYNFIGWTFEGQTTPTKNVTITKGTTGNKSYTANWEAISSTITLNPNGGSCTPITIDVTYDKNFTLPEPEWAGHAFSGWYIGNTKITSGICKFTEDTTLVAEWDIIQYTISYTMNGGTNASTNPRTYNCYDTITLAEPERKGYTFLGWTFAGQTTPTKDVTIVVGTMGNKTYTANWQANTYTVLLDANGGTTPPTMLDATFDTNVTLPTPERTGYSFDGWFDGSTKYTSGTWKTDSDVILVAKWTAKSYKATYDANGGSVSSSYEYYTYEKEYTLLEPTRTGYEFLGWYELRFYGEDKLIPQTGTWDFDYDRSFVAKWKACVYTVTYDAGAGTSSAPSAQATYDSNFTLATAYRVGYVFEGWYYNGVKYVDGKWKTTKDITLTAKWTARTDIPYVVNHYQQNANNDKYTLESTLNLTGTADATITPVVKNFTHFISPSAQTVTIAPDGSLVVNYYYDRVTYDLTYVTNGGNAIEKQTYKYDQTLVIATPTRTGYTFGGWFTDKTLATAYSATATLNANKTIYAYWSEENKPTDFTYSGTDAITVSAYNGTSTTMWIPSYIGGVPVTKIPASAFENQTTVVKVVLPDTVTSIGSAAFSGCSGLESIVLPFVGGSAKTENDSYQYPFGYIFGSNSYTGGTGTTQCYYYNVYNGYSNTTNATYYIPASLKSVTITGGNILYGAFYGCSGLTSITLPENVTNIGNSAFYQCSGLTSITLPENVTNIGNSAFYQCSGLTSITIPDGVTSIRSYAFSGCSAITSITLPENVISIGDYAFSGCSTLTSITIPDSVTSIGGSAFSGCSGLESIVLPFVGGSAKTENDSYQYPFGYIFGTGSYTGGVATVQDYFAGTLGYTSTSTFYIPENLKSVTITGGNILHGAFYNCKGLTSITLPDSATSIGRYAFLQCVSLTSITIPDSVTSIGSHAFYQCNSLTSITIPDGVTSIGNYTFYDCKALAEFTIPQTVETIGDGAFNGCTSILKINSDVEGELNIPSSVTSIGYSTFKGLVKITKVYVPDSITSWSYGIFEGCTSIEEITVPFIGLTSTGSSDQYYVFDSVFSSSPSSSNTHIPESVKKVTINKQTELPYNAFFNCKYIEEINLPANATSIGSYAFYGCSALLRLNSEVDGVFNIPEGTTEIKSYAFYNCLLAETIDFGSNITVIGNSAFAGCTSITKINSATEGELNIPSSVTTVGTSVFKGLTGITKVYVPDSITSWNYAMFEGCTSIEEITVPFIGLTSTGSSDQYYVFDSLFSSNPSTSNTNVPKSIKKVTVNKQTELPYRAFYGCKYIEEINIPENVTSIGKSAFYECSALVRLNSAVDGLFNIPDGVTVINPYTFYSCLLAETINLSDDTTTIGIEAFYGCTMLTVFTIPDTVETIGDSAFSGCVSLLKINSKVEGELNVPTGVKTIGAYAFKGLAGISKVCIPDSVTSWGYGIFEGCTSIEEMAVPFVGYLTSDGYDIRYRTFDSLFTSNSNYTNTYVPTSIRKVTINKQTAIPQYAFYNCKYIEEINLPESTTSIGSNAFYGCSALLRLNSEVDGVFNIPTGVMVINSYTFYKCLLVESINLGANVNAIHSYALADCKSLTDFTIPATVTELGDSVFAGCVSITKINSKTEGELNVPSRVTKIGSSTFKGLAGITKVHIPNSITSWGYGIFEGCTSIEELTIPFVGYRTSDSYETRYRTFDSLFTSNSNYTNTYVPASIRKVTINKQTAIPQYAFYNCKYIEEINIPESTTSIGSYAFYGCSALLRLNSEVDGVFNIPEDITEIQSYTFYNCLLVEVVNVGESIIKIKDYAFANCKSIKQFNSTNEGELVIPESVRNIYSYAFQGLVLITKVIVPDSVSEIYTNTFKGCNAIEEITLPFVGTKIGTTTEYYTVFGAIFGYDTGSLYNHPSQNYDIPLSIKKVTITAQTVIPEYAFRNCNFIESIILPSNVTSVGDNSFYNCTATVSYTHNATTSIWNGTDVSTSLSGWGSESNPYQINSAADLAYLASSVNAGESYEGKYFVLNININLNTKSWTPIGTKSNPFAGTFDGNGKKIYNLSVTMNTAYVGLFGYVSGTVKELAIISGTLAPVSNAGATYVGPLVAYLTGTVENCYSKAVVSTSITNNVYAGGLIGHVDTAATVKDSYASGHVSATSTSGFAYAGGFVGANKGTIDGCLAFGNVTAKGSNETYSRNGGFAATNDGTLTECYRSEKQKLIKYTTAGSAYCEDGTVDSIADMIAYANTNWDSSIWNDELLFKHQHTYMIYATVVTPPTATENGSKTHTCSVCGVPHTEIIVPADFTITADNRALIGYTGAANESLVIPAVFEEKGIWYRIASISESAFKDCTLLTSINIPNSVTDIGKGAFSGCYSLQSITLPFVGGSKFATDASTSTLFGYIFGSSKYNGSASTTQVCISGNWEKTTYYYIPYSLKSVTVTGGNIFNGTFYNCSNLTSVTIGDGVTSIDFRAFENCSNLTSVIIPDSVTSIGYFAFMSCSSLTSIVFEGTIEQWNTITFGNVWNGNAPATYVQCSNGTVSLK